MNAYMYIISKFRTENAMKKKNKTCRNRIWFAFLIEIVQLWLVQSIPENLVPPRDFKILFASLTYVVLLKFILINLS